MSVEFGCIGFAADRSVKSLVQMAGGLLGLFALCVSLLLSPVHAQDVERLQPGEALATQFSGTRIVDGVTVIDESGTVGSVFDIRAPGTPPRGEHWWNEPQRLAVTAGQVGQVFGIALDDASPPNIYLTATAAFGLHRNPDNSDWMAGMWGEDGGPGTVYRLRADNDYRPEVFAHVTLEGRANTGAALGNIAFDRWNRQFYVSDLETGMIHVLALEDGAELGRFDHGVDGRTDFYDAVFEDRMSLDPVAFDPETGARTDDCAAGAFDRTPECWNLADFRRRVWGLGVHRNDATGTVRLYYAIWGSAGLGNPAWDDAGDDQRNAVWSVGTGQDGAIDVGSVRREFALPDFFTDPAERDRHGPSHPVSDIAFQMTPGRNVMILAERGGMRNLGLDREAPFAMPHGARVLRFELDENAVWQPVGRYDIGYYDRRGEGAPFLRANSAGGVSFGYGYGPSHELDLQQRDAWLWATGDRLCSSEALCFDSSAGTHTDASQVHGLQGAAELPFDELMPGAAAAPYPEPGPATPAHTPNRSAMIDLDINVDAAGNGIEAELVRNDATLVGDVEVFQRGEPAPYPDDVDVADLPVDEGAIPDFPPVEPPDEGLWPPDGAPELGLVKTGPAVCAPGGLCTYAITITNHGGAPYAGPVFVQDFPPEGSLLFASSFGWSCTAAEDWINCTSTPVVMAPGDAITLIQTVELPPEILTATVENCGNIIWPAADATSWARVRLWVEQVLAFEGRLDPALVDGTMSPETHDAIRAYQHDHGLPETGTITPGLLATMFPASSRMAGDANDANDGMCIETPIDPAAVPALSAFELGIAKDLVGACRPGEECIFDITVTNNGDGAFNGDLSIGEVIVGLRDEDGAWVPATWPRAVSPGWNCDGDGSGGACELDGVYLGPGESGTFRMNNPLDRDFAESRLRNCARFRWEGMGVEPDANEDNDEACITIDVEPLVIDPETEDVDLAITKAVPHGHMCHAGERCVFVVTIENRGTQDYTGTVAFDDHANIEGTGIPAEDITTPGAWDCSRAGASEHIRRCSWSGSIGNGDGVSVEMVVAVPDTSADVTLYNCAEIAWDGMEFPLGRDANSDNDGEVCAETEILPAEEPEEPGSGGANTDMAIEIDPRGPCPRGEWCRFDARLLNLGPDDFSGDVVINRNFTLIATDGTEEVIFSAAVRREDEEIAHGGVLEYQPGPEIPDEDGYQSVRVCETFNVAASGITEPDTDAARDNNTACRVAEITERRESTDFSMDVLERDACTVGGPCFFEWELTNLGPTEYTGEPAVHHVLTAVSESGAETVLDDSIYTYSEQHLVPFGADAEFLWDYRWTIPEDAEYTQVRMCNTFLPDESGVTELDTAEARGNNADCATIDVRGRGADISLEGHSSCQRGATCRDITLSLTNEGDETYSGMLGLRGTLRPVVPIVSVEAEGGWNCQPLQAGAYNCHHTAFTLAPGASQTIRLVVDIPRAFAENRIRHEMQLIWPGHDPDSPPPEGAGDTNPENDRDGVWVTITDTAPVITCQNGKVVDGVCVCRRGWKPRRLRENIYRCRKTPPQLQCIKGKVVRGDCVCPKQWKRVRESARVFRCVEPQRQLQCIKGKIVRGDCVCPKRWKRVRKSAYVFQCVKPPKPDPQLRCVKGKILAGNCLCPKGWKKVREKDNVYRCVKPRKQITCVGGKISSGKCYCPGGWKRTRTGTNAWRCTKPVQRIKCSNGKVVGSKCVCPRDRKLVRVSKNAFRCVPKARPIRCSGGTVVRGRCECPRGMRARRVTNRLYRCVKK